MVVKSSGFYGRWWNKAVVFSKSDRTKYHHFPMLFFPMNINYKKWWHKAVVFTGNGGTKRWFYSKVVEQSATTLYLAGVLGECSPN
ncbi:hypothetical protein ROSEINA2194_03915 [Roseburia inulinivorans DSM 16841]|uniref:Uncharacterized protein n=4 Tax=Lachnospiraceae TaxID=186803 RepID=C0FYS5_9FIRM|nr:hypothetical protein ROSEINA2194_03915 [Roseburia inulinivorans DSM 16841]EFF68082.1 hypothetical protein BUTYVIB_01746 [Butyrivibrio crossotus DSM 2876]MBD9036748.1 hypothetical protein [Agathobacter rectalis]OKZ59672.1 MAG: hypothetical protein BHV92_00615 [Clostridiales bacterium 45_37]RHC16973.1 hypothetical protein DW856_08865 [Roseburia intestinalis]